MILGPASDDAPGRSHGHIWTVRELGVSFYGVDLLNRESGCILPFIAADLASDGQYALCCEAERSQFNVRDQGIAQWFAGNEMQSARDIMKVGAIPLACHRCFKKEMRGEDSMRLRIWRFFDHGAYGAGETLLSSPELRLLFYRFGNSCNLSCLMCNSAASSTFGQEAERLGEGPWRKYSNPVDLCDAELAKMQVLYLGGGEPSMSKECMSLLERLWAVKKGDVAVVLNTNGTLPHSPLFAKLRAFKYVLVGFSIDGIGDSYNLIRHPMTWDKLETNIQIMFNNYPEFNYEIWFTLNNLNLAAVPAFLQWWLGLCQESPAGHVQLNFSEVVSPEFLQLSLCAPSEIQNVLELVRPLLSDARVEQNEERLKSLHEIITRLTLLAKSLVPKNGDAHSLLLERDMFIQKRLRLRAQTNVEVGLGAL